MTTLHERDGGPTAVPLTGHQYHIDAGPYRAEAVTHTWGIDVI